MTDTLVPSSAVVWFDHLTIDDVAIAGGKGANLGELASAGFPVPDGFVVSAPAYLRAMELAGVRTRLAELAAREDPDEASVTARAKELQDLVRDAGMPYAIRREVVAAYRRLGADTFVAVRSSATGEDSVVTSFAGMNETFTDVAGEDALVRRVVDCWASLFGARACVYRASQHVRAEPAIAVVVQRMVDAQRSGVMFTADPRPVTGRGS